MCECGNPMIFSTFKIIFLALCFLGWDRFSAGFPKTGQAGTISRAGVYPSYLDYTALGAMTGH